MFCYLILTLFCGKDNNGTCQPTQVGACIPCQYYPGENIYYYQIKESQYWSSGFVAYSYYDSLCTEEYSSVISALEQCSPDKGWQNCIFFSLITSATTLSLTLTSTEAVAVSFIGEDDLIYTQISSNKVSAQGVNLSSVQVHSDGKNFFVERQVSSTQYTSNLGVFTLGQTYTHTPFTFTVSASEVDFPLPPASSDVTTVYFEPFFSAQVTDDSSYSTLYQYNAGIYVFVDGSYSLDGLVLTNPFYSIQNMTFYPPFQSNNNHGELVFQLEASSSPFLTVECHQNSISLMSNTGYTYECEMGSLRGSFLSLSIEVGEQKIRQPDEMSFSLF